MEKLEKKEVKYLIGIYIIVIIFSIFITKRLNFLENRERNIYPNQIVAFQKI